jgi:hypothetical protein
MVVQSSLTLLQGIEHTSATPWMAAVPRAMVEMGMKGDSRVMVFYACVKYYSRRCETIATMNAVVSPQRLIQQSLIQNI